MKIGNRIITLRRNNGVTQTELGKAIGVGKTTISNYETGYSTPDAETLIRIADYFDVSLDYLFGRTNDLNPLNTKISPNWLRKFLRIIKSQRAQASTEALPLLIMQMASLYAVSKGILPPEELSSLPIPPLTEQDKNRLVNEIDRLLEDSDLKNETSLLAQEIESLPPRERQAMEAMLDVLKHRNDKSAAQES